jgi:hypothetical protein
MTTIDQAATLIFITLNADATLQDANHLTAAGRIFKSATRPAGVSNPSLAMRLIPATIIGEQSYGDEWLLWLNLFIDNFTDLTPDHIRASRIETRIEFLIGSKVLADANVDKLMIERDVPGRMLPPDPDAASETPWNFQYLVTALT